MFDFGNKKEIETLKQVIAKLTFENMEKDKTVDYLIGEVNKLSNRVKELEEELEKEKLGIECEFKEDFISKKDENGNEIKFYETLNTRYKDVYEIIEKINATVENDEFTYFKINKESDGEFNYFCNKFQYKNLDVLINNFIKYNCKNNTVFTYHQIPFRNLDDLYKIMDFFESIKHIEFFNAYKENEKVGYNEWGKKKYERRINQWFEIKEVEIIDKIKLKLLTNNNIKISIDDLSVHDFINKFYKENNNIKYYRQKKYPSFEFEIFDNEKELRKIMKKYMYKKKDGFCDARWFKKKINE